MDNSWYFYNGFPYSHHGKAGPCKDTKSYRMFGNNISFTYNMQTVYNAMMGLRYIVNNDDKIEMNPKLFEGRCPLYPEVYGLQEFYDMPLAFGVSRVLTGLKTTTRSKYRRLLQTRNGCFRCVRYLMPTISDSSNMRILRQLAPERQLLLRQD